MHLRRKLLVLAVLGATFMAAPLAAATDWDEWEDDLDDDFFDLDAGFFPGTSDVEIEVRSERSQNVDIDEDDVLAALVLGGGFFDVADVEIDLERSVSVDRDVDLDEDDVLLLLALRGGDNDLDDRSDVETLALLSLL